MKTNILARRVAAFTLPAVLAACGGGGDSSPAVETTATPTALSISGTAATGAAIVGGSVEVKCAAGTGSATTIADGSYTVTISGGSLPCVLRVTSGSTALYSLAENNGGSAVRANVTPFTQLIAAQVAGGDPANLYAGFDGVSAQTFVSAAKVASSISAVTDALAGTVALNGANPLTASFVIGDAFDQQLDAFKAALDKAQLTLADVSDALVAAGGSAAPVKTILQPAAASCAGLRSGRYRALNPGEADPLWANHVFQLDVDTLKATFWDDSSSTLVDQGGCSFVVDGSTQLLVSKSGVTIARDTATPTQTAVTVIIPEQTIALSELAGTWNVLSYVRDTATGPLTPSAAVFTLDAAGKFSAGSDCIGLAACSAWTGLPGDLKASTGGGFEFIDTDGSTYKVFAFKASEGQLSLYVLEPNRTGFSVAAKQQALSLPTVGTANSFWDFTINSSGYGSTLSETATTVVSIDTAAQSYSRQRASDGRIDGFAINSPRTGLRYRAAGSSPINSGGSVSFSEIISMTLPGTGVGVYTSVAANQNFFGISVNKP